MNKIIRALYRKEMLGILRDKKMMLVMILVPVLLYPLLFLAGIYLSSTILSHQDAKTYLVSFADVDTSYEKALTTLFEDPDRKTTDSSFRIVPTSDLKNGDWKSALNDKEIDLCITQSEKDGKTLFVLHYLSSVSNSSNALDRVKTVMDSFSRSIQENNVRAGGLDVQKTLYSIDTEEQDLSSHEESVGSMIGSFLPFLMIVSILMGASYPAIDTTAGEKERGTLETLLTLPVNNLQLILSKFLVVSTVASFCALLNFLSLGMIGVFLYQNMQSQAHFSIHMGSFVPAMLITLVTILIFSMLLSALCLCICIFAKSFKEAQNYTSPLLIVVMLIGYVGMIPGSELTRTYALIPVANVVLMIKSVFSMQFYWNQMILVLVSNIAYTFLAILFMSRIYNSEALLFGAGGNVKLFERRDNMKPGQTPGIGDAFFLLAVSVLGMFYISSIAQMKLGFWGIPSQQILFAGLVTAMAWYMKLDWKNLFSLQRPKPSAIPGAVLLWVGCYLSMLLLSIPLSSWLHESAGELESLNAYFDGQPAWALILVIAILPALCEELFFRGFLFGTLRAHWKPWAAILFTAFLFACYHMSLIKLFTIMILGTALTYAVYETGSLFVSILMHLCNNLLAVISYIRPQWISQVLPFLNAEKSSTTELLVLSAASVLCIVCGVLLLHRKK